MDKVSLKHNINVLKAHLDKSHWLSATDRNRYSLWLEDFESQLKEKSNDIF